MACLQEQAEVLEKLCSVLPNGLQSMVIWNTESVRSLNYKATHPGFPPKINTHGERQIKQPRKNTGNG